MCRLPNQDRHFVSGNRSQPSVSSLPSWQFLRPSQTLFFSMHKPSLHRHCSNPVSGLTGQVDLEVCLEKFKMGIEAVISRFIWVRFMSIGNFVIIEDPTQICLALIKKTIHSKTRWIVSIKAKFKVVIYHVCPRITIQVCKWVEFVNTLA